MIKRILITQYIGEMMKNMIWLQKPNVLLQMQVNDMLKVFSAVPMELWARLLGDVKDIIECMVKAAQ